MGEGIGYNRFENEVMEKYIFVRSSESREFYPENRPYDFKIHLDNTLDLHGYWKIGIAEFFTLSSTQKTVIDKSTSKPVTTFYHKSLFVYSDVCDFSSVNGHQEPLLRVIQSDPSYGWNDKSFPMYYIPLKVIKLSNLHWYLRDDTGSLATFIDSDVWMTLHLIRYPFFSHGC